MASSGARGSFKQIRQLAGMRGLMANPKGEIIERPIKSNFLEGLDVLEYFISTHGARKGLADTALRTADSGYLTRRLVDVSQDVIIRIEDCGTDQYLELPLWDGADANVQVMGRVLAAPVKSGSKTILPKDAVIKRDEFQTLVEAFPRGTNGDAPQKIAVRTVLKCEATTGVCQACYGVAPGTGRPAQIRGAAGPIAAPSVGAPGTQLTTRTFHTRG